MNHIELEGTLAENSEPRVLDGGSMIVDARVAVSEKDKDGNAKTVQYPFTAFAKTADALSKLAVGDLIRVSGKIKLNEYVKEGEVRQYISLLALGIYKRA